MNSNYEIFIDILEEISLIQEKLNFPFLENININLSMSDYEKKITTNFLKTYCKKIEKKYYKEELENLEILKKETKYLKKIRGLNLFCIDFSEEFKAKALGHIENINREYVAEKLIEFILKNRFIYLGFEYIFYSLLKYKNYLRKHNIIFFIRDPRDCEEIFLGVPQNQRKVHIASNEINNISGFQDIHLNKEHLNNRFEDLKTITAFLNPNVTLYKYEDIWFNKCIFFRDLIHRNNLIFDQEIYDQIIDTNLDILTNSFTNSTKLHNPPGYYRNKIPKEIIEIINNNNKPILQLYNFF